MSFDNLLARADPIEPIITEPIKIPIQNRNKIREKDDEVLV